MARQAGEITAVEGFRTAVASGKLNAQNNGIENIHWLCAAVPRAVAQFKRQRQKFSKIVLDPPRTGAKGIEADISRARRRDDSLRLVQPERPWRATWPPSASLVISSESVQPIDFFPHTFHVESLAVLTR